MTASAGLWKNRLPKRGISHCLVGTQGYRDDRNAVTEEEAMRFEVHKWLPPKKPLFTEENLSLGHVEGIM